MIVTLLKVYSFVRQSNSLHGTLISPTSKLGLGHETFSKQRKGSYPVPKLNDDNLCPTVYGIMIRVKCFSYL